MSEFLKIATNGQWALEKNWSSKHVNSVGQWAETGLPKHIKKVPSAKGDLKDQMMSELQNHTDFRINPKTKEKEYKLYRAAAVGNNNHTKQQTSWTAAPDFANYWAHIQGNPMGEAKVPFQTMHAWIPEKHIHSYLAPTLKNMGHEKWGEHEVLVHPHNVNIDKTFSGPSLDKQIKMSRKRHNF
jgi:hypothetical protein